MKEVDKPKRSSDGYFKFKKTITDKLVIKHIEFRATRERKTRSEVCYDIVRDWVLAQLPDNKKELR